MMTDEFDTIIPLLLKNARGKRLTKKERTTLEQWLFLSDENQYLYSRIKDKDQVEEIFRQLDAIPSKRMIRTILQKIGKESGTLPPQRQRTIWRTIALVAISIALVLYLRKLFAHYL